MVTCTMFQAFSTYPKGLFYNVNVWKAPTEGLRIADGLGTSYDPALSLVFTWISGLCFVVTPLILLFTPPRLNTLLLQLTEQPFSTRLLVFSSCPMPFHFSLRSFIDCKGFSPIFAQLKAILNSRNFLNSRFGKLCCA